MKALVTGAAGFIGSHLSEELLARGYDVLGVDAFTEYYDRVIKEQNLAQALRDPRYRFVEADLVTASLPELVDRVDVVFHLAGQPGVRPSWGDQFRQYLDRNVLATQRILEELRGRRLQKLVFASSSSVYGNAERYPTRESDLPQPISPYGVTKLASERLCLAYHSCYGLPVVALRYFTVYGPRQRPDMAFSRFITSLLHGDAIGVFGNGEQTREFTYVRDAVDATIRAAECEAGGAVVNVGGGERIALLDVLKLLGELAGVEPKLRFESRREGDVLHTGADPALAEAILGYRAQTPLRAGLRQQVDYVASADGVSAA